MSSKLEKSIAKAIIEKTIPGAVPAKGKEVVYFCDDGHRSKHEQFRAIAPYTAPPQVRYGGAGMHDCSLILPDGSIFHAVEYFGDLAGWQQVFEEASTRLKIALARIDGDNLVVSDGRAFALSDCVPKRPIHSELEKIHGGSVGFDGTVPGTVPVDGVEIVYFCDDGRSSKRKQFDALTTHTNHCHTQRGGANTRGCALTLPDGSIFHAIGYHGDIAGWRQDIEEGAAGLKIALARIDGDKLIISDGRVIALSDCTAKFD